MLTISVSVLDIGTNGWSSVGKVSWIRHGDTVVSIIFKESGKATVTNDFSMVGRNDAMEAWNASDTPFFLSAMASNLESSCTAVIIENGAMSGQGLCVTSIMASVKITDSSSMVIVFLVSTSKTGFTAVTSCFDSDVSGKDDNGLLV